MVEAGCFSLRLEQVFLINLKGEEIYQRIKDKVERRERLAEEELMQLIILPLTEKGSDKKKQRIEQVVELAKEVNEDSQAFLLANLLVISDKFIDDGLSRDIRRWLKMTKVARLIAEETSREIAEKLLLLKVDDNVIAKGTGITIDEIKKSEES